ncbi:MAG TPA: hypothetical protein VGC85_10420 [Chthoniobacterales bacterium]|jgi:hypothetical protein
MNAISIAGDASNLRDDVTSAFRHELDRAYAAMVRAAGRQWARRFGHGDPSDACVTVRITGYEKRSLRTQRYLSA